MVRPLVRLEVGELREQVVLLGRKVHLVHLVQAEQVAQAEYLVLLEH